jgi:putative ABC transport system permease protein
MLRNYLTIAWRNLTKHKLFSFINIFGLASGMTVCMLAMIKIKEAYDYDTFHPNSNKTYRIITTLDRKNGEQFLCASSPLPLATYLKKNYTVIDKSTSVYFSHEEVSVSDKKLWVKEAFTDGDFYKIFGFELLAGSPATAEQTVVLTEETAQRFFGKENAIGRTLTMGEAVTFTVTGVLKKPAYPSHLKFDLLANSSAIPLLRREKIFEEWKDEAAAYTYVQLKSGSSRGALETILKNVTKQVNSIMPPSSGKTFVFASQPLDKISPGIKPMYNTTEEPIFPNLIAFALIGFSMLLLAFFNYVNLTLARSLDRAREVGIRKVAGALKKHLMLQFLSESVLVAIFAFCLAYVLLKAISRLQTVQNIIGDAVQDKTLSLYFIVFTLLTGVFAGWIPARVLSGFQPVRVLKGKFNTRLFGGVGLRKTLTVIQFAVSLVAIVTLMVFYRQSTYMATANYGFQRERILNIQLPEDSYQVASSALSSTAGVEDVSGTSGLFGFSAAGTKFVKRNKVSDSLNAAYFSISPSLVKNMGLQIIAGKNLPAATAVEGTRFVLINEEASRALQFTNPADASGKLIWLNDSTNYTVAGVVKDFHYASFLRPIQPLLLANNPSEFRTLNLKVAKGAEQGIIPLLESTWKKLYHGQPFEADWFDKQLYDQHLHKDDLVFMGLLTGMALSIACLGLLGMVIYTSKNRAKEVSIRRVMGAGVRQVIFTMSREFVGLLLLSVCIGLPLGFFVGQEFLQQYAYRITLGFTILAGSAVSLLLLGGITIGWQTYRTALTNPAKSLRIE